MCTPYVRQALVNNSTCYSVIFLIVKIHLKKQLLCYKYDRTEMFREHDTRKPPARGDFKMADQNFGAKMARWLYR